MLDEVMVKNNIRKSEANEKELSNDSFITKLALSYITFMKIDIATIEASDLYLPKWAGHLIFGTISYMILYDKILNPNLEGTHTSVGTPWIPNDNSGFDNDNDYYRPGDEPPKWFWPAIGAVAAYELYENWPKVDALPNDKTKVEQPIIKPIIQNK